MKFTMMIESDNAEMLNRRNVADALVKVAKRLKDYPAEVVFDDIDIRDVNGNTVGHWSYEPSEDGDDD